MKELPESEIYEQELIYMPYRKSQEKVLEVISSKTPENAELLDLMCGPGHLLGQIAEKRPDIKLFGSDFDKRYIDFAKKKYPNIGLNIVDVLNWEPTKKYDVVICTGSLHHITYDKQAEIVKKIASATKPDRFAIISDCHIDDYKNEIERKIAAEKLGYEYLIETTKNGAPNEVVEATIDILYNDVMMNEFKTSIKKRLPVYKKYFSDVETIKTWPDFESGYGDYIMICKK